MTSWWVPGCGTRVGIPGGYWEGYTGYPATLLGEVPISSEAGPEALQGPEWWDIGTGRPGEYGGGGTALHPPCGPGRSHPGPSLVQDLSNTRLLANKGEIPRPFP